MLVVTVIKGVTKTQKPTGLFDPPTGNQKQLVLRSEKDPAPGSHTCAYDLPKPPFQGKAAGVLGGEEKKDQPDSSMGTQIIHPTPGIAIRPHLLPRRKSADPVSEPEIVLLVESKLAQRAPLASGESFDAIEDFLKDGNELLHRDLARVSLIRYGVEEVQGESFGVIGCSYRS
jgi:hypothetical protein